MQHDFPFDPTHGYDLDALRQVAAPAEPSDFEAFWRATYDEAMRPPLNLAHRPIESPHPAFEVYEVEFDSLDDVRIGGWITVPRDGSAERAVVVGHGYGGRTGPDFALPGPPAVAIFPCARGFDRSARPDLPDRSARHVLHGLADRSTYIHRGCAADLWRAASAVLELYPQWAGRLHYQGGSFGGGIGALMLPWDPRFSRAALHVPSFGNHPLRVTLPCTGSGEAVRLRFKRHPEVLEVLRYFDAATAAARIRIPVLCSCALFDPAVPPPGQFAVHNALVGPRELVVCEAGHFTWPSQAEDEAQRLAAIARWMSAGR